MSDAGGRIACVIVAHGDVGECLMNAVQGILGSQTGWTAVSNSGMGLPELAEAVRKAVEELARGHAVLLITDMPGGSCHHVCQAYLGERPGLRMISGVNLMMLLEFFVKREREGLADLVSLMQERAKDAVRVQ
jgi:mannose/fructose-specific phosphotransferase system component IIA